MDESESTDPGRYDVVVNDEEQYSIWPAGRAIPAGWQTAGFQGAKSACLDYVAEVWTDMRPKSLRVQMEGQGRPQAGA